MGEKVSYDGVSWNLNQQSSLQNRIQPAFMDRADAGPAFPVDELYFGALFRFQSNLLKRRFLSIAKVSGSPSALIRAEEDFIDFQINCLPVFRFAYN